MKTNIKKLYTLALCAILITALMLTGCSNTKAPETQSQTPNEESTPSQSPSDLKIGVVMKSFDEFQTAVINGAIDQAVQMGVKKENIITLAPKSESDVMGQIQMIENCVSQGCDIIIVAAEDPTAVIPPLQQAAESGIKIVMADTDAPDFKHPNKVTYIGTENYTAAYEGAKIFLSEYVKPGSNVVILRGKLGDTNHDSRTKGMEKAIEEAGCNVLDVQDANCEPDKAANIMETWIQKYGDKIDAVMNTSDNMTVGAVTSIKAANKLDQIAVCGFDGFQVAIKEVAAGTVEMIIAQKPYWIGQEAVKCGMGALLEGKQYDEYIMAGIQVIDASNYQDFLAE